LIEEEHYAVTFLYNSVKNLRSTRSTARVNTDDLLDEIQTILQTKMICNYRNILRVYSGSRLSFYHKNGIRLSKTRKREVTSKTFNGYSVIISRLSRAWMTNILSFINDVHNKIK
jgi:hypothetical protein